MKLPLTTIEYYDIKFYIFRMHWCTITKLCMYHRDHDLKVLKTFWDSVTLWSKVIMKFQINANSFLWILTIVMRLVLIDWLQLLISADGLMLASVVLGPVISACSYIFIFVFIASSTSSFRDGAGMCECRCSLCSSNTSLSLCLAGGSPATHPHTRNSKWGEMFSSQHSNGSHHFSKLR